MNESAKSEQHDEAESRAIDALLDGDRDAYSYLMAKYMRKVISVAWSIVRNREDAEELAQEAFVRAFEKIRRFRRSEKFGPWIYRITTNLSLDLLKSRRRHPAQPLDESHRAARRDDADLGASSTELATRIDEALQSLPEMQQIVARLFLVEGFEHREIARMTDLSDGTVRSHLSHARRKLQEKLFDLHGG